MKLSHVILLLVSVYIIYSSCNSLEKYRRDLLSDNKHKINRACVKLGRARDTSTVKLLLRKALDPRISHRWPFYATSVNHNRLNALEKISGKDVRAGTNRFGADTAATLYYLKWAIKKGYIKDSSEVDIYYYKRKENVGTSYKWTQVTKQAAFPKSYNFQLFSIRDTLWAMHHDGVWFSVDGQEWTKSPLTNIIQNNAFLDYVWFKNALYSIGRFEGNVEQHKLLSSIHRTYDMKNWETVAVESNLPKRYFYHPFVFRDKLWIIGGTDGTNTFSDIWNSADGVHWVKQAENLPFGKREHAQFVTFNEKLFMLNNDVWTSADGINWSKLTDRLAKETIFGYVPVVYDNQIWLLGCNRDGVFQSQVLVSKDGKAWETKSAPWSPRGAASACIYKGKIFMTGGKYGGLTKDGKTTEFVYSNDVWTMEEQ